MNCEDCFHCQTLYGGFATGVCHARDDQHKDYDLRDNENNFWCSKFITYEEWRIQTGRD